MALTFEAWFV